MTIPGQEKPKDSRIPIFNARTNTVEDVAPVTKTDEEWKALLTPEQFERSPEERNRICIFG